MASPPRTIQKITIYPVKSCGGLNVDRCLVGPEGLELDRCWAIIDVADGRVVDQRACNRLCRIQPSLDLPAYLKLTLLQDDAVECGICDELAVPLALDAYRDKDIIMVSDRVEHQWYGAPLRAFSAGPEAASWITAVMQQWHERNGQFALVRYASGRRVANAFGGEAAALCQPEDTAAFHDGAPIHAVTQASLTWLGKKLGREAFDCRRTRANLVVDGHDIEHAEETWSHVLVGGKVHFRHLAAVPRCEVLLVDPTTGQRETSGINPTTGRRGGDPLSVLLRTRPPIQRSSFRLKGCLGAFFALDGEAGEIKVGDSLEVSSEHIGVTEGLRKEPSAVMTTQAG
eukprot:gnl/TRDRNA2_/TRDRNA2_82412_c0_seq2.p1 gnl/TRDRNA2_/TRDRNA2_82412_c0~~gnl/TRDRNA2_/TRDRNA2_82412_c0_seq2.p1  ORF type:complete len:352 (+),score=43.72 gnl/TRDRNA2_/TRDRNA2_82412_c0_seq2:28-1056(+)